MAERFAWNRWICPRDKPILFDSDGYPENPSGRYGNVVQPHCIPLPRILDAHCGILLGEAGIGKSDAMREIEEEILLTRGEAILKVDLGEYGDIRDLAADLFESQVLREWQEGGHELNIVLDSLDEGIAGIKNIVGLLQRRLRNLPFERLHLYISCRTTAWPETLTKHLVESFGNEQAVALYQMVPLLKSDVVLAARATVDADRFLAEVHEHNAHALACNPLTLQLLLNVFRSTGFPASNLELLERGLLVLCETTQAQRDHGNAAFFTAPQLLAVASRAAALAILSGRPVIETAADIGNPHSGVPLTECLGGEEGDGNARVAVDDAAMRAALRTGLFNARGPERFGFAHKTYGEFLVARLLSKLELPIPQLESLLCLSDRTPCEYIPQLHEVIAWLASFDGRLVERLIETEPDILLGADLPAENAATRGRIVDAILARVQAGYVSYDRRRELAPRLSRLGHPGLSAQLTAAISNRAFSDATREMALTIAEQCNATDVATAAADIAVNGMESLNLRVDAAYAVDHLNAPAVSARLKPLVFLPAQEDPLDQLRGVSLRACWPDQMTATELFDALRPPRRRNFGGSYSYFLFGQTIAEQLAPPDLAIGLAWVARQHLDRSYSDSLTRVAGGIVTRAFRDTRHDLVAQLVPIVYAAYHDFRCPFFCAPVMETIAVSNDTVAVNAMLAAGLEMRRHLITAIVDSMPTDTRFYLLAHSDCPLVREEDLEWLLDKACRTIGERAVNWAQLAKRAMNWASVEHLDQWLRATDGCPAVAGVLNYPRVIELDSPEAQRLRDEYHLQQHQEQDASRRQIAPAVQSARIERVLANALADRPEQFAHLAAELHRDLNSGAIPHVPSDLRTTRGWHDAAPETRLGIVNAAERYLINSDMPTSEPLRTLKTWSLADETPALALLLLLHERPAAVNALPEGVWQRRTGHILARLIGFFEATPADKDALASVLYAHASEQCHALILAVLDDATAVDEASSMVDVWENRLDNGLAAEIFDRIHDPTFAETAFKSLLAWLLRHNYEPAAEYVTALLGDTRDPRCLSVAIVVGRQRPERFWPAIWRLMESDHNWGRAFIEQFLGFIDEGRRLLPALRADDAGRLLDWLLSEYPPVDEDPTAGGIVSTRDHVRFFRNALIERLRQAGTREACTALKTVRDAHPEQPWLSEVLLEAQATERRSSWTPPGPADLRRLFSNRHARLVTNAPQLLDVIRESLDRLAETLHGELPARTNLWDEVRAEIYRPKDEEHLSDTVARHLRGDLVDRGIIANREVQIRRREVPAAGGGQPGERTDIRVDVATRPTAGGQPEILTAIIEVKGCWHPEVATAMQTQLVDRYLRENRCQTGLYLVGWYRSAAWDRDDPRQRQVPWPTIEAAQTDLQAQARQLTTADGTRQIQAYVLDCALR